MEVDGKDRKQVDVGSVAPQANAVESACRLVYD